MSNSAPMDQLPLESFRIILNEVILEVDGKQLLDLRLVSRAFNSEVWIAMKRCPVFDQLVVDRIRARAETRNKTNLEFEGYLRLPEILRPLYYYYRLRRPDRRREPFWRTIDPIFRCELRANGLEEMEGIEADRVLLKLCEGLTIQETIWKPSGSVKFYPNPWANPLEEPLLHIQRFPVEGSDSAARLNRAIRRHDCEELKRALAEGATLKGNWRMENAVHPWFRSNHLQSAMYLGDERILSIILNHREFRRGSIPLWDLVSMIFKAGKDADTTMIRTLLSSLFDTESDVPIQLSKIVYPPGVLRKVRYWRAPGYGERQLWYQSLIVEYGSHCDKFWRHKLWRSWADDSSNIKQPIMLEYPIKQPDGNDTPPVSCPEWVGRGYDWVVYYEKTMQLICDDGSDFGR